MNQKPQNGNGFRITGKMMAGAFLSIVVILLTGFGGWVVTGIAAANEKAEAAERTGLRVEGDVKAIHVRMDSADDKFDSMDRKLDKLMEYMKPKEH